jgi:hypothetical protein
MAYPYRVFKGVSSGSHQTAGGLRTPGFGALATSPRGMFWAASVLGMRTYTAGWLVLGFVALVAVLTLARLAGWW